MQAGYAAAAQQGGQQFGAHRLLHHAQRAVVGGQLLRHAQGRLAQVVVFASQQGAAF